MNIQSQKNFIELIEKVLQPYMQITDRNDLQSAVYYWDKLRKLIIGSADYFHQTAYPASGLAGTSVYLNFENTEISLINTLITSQPTLNNPTTEFNPDYCLVFNRLSYPGWNGWPETNENLPQYPVINNIRVPVFIKGNLIRIQNNSFSTISYSDSFVISHEKACKESIWGEQQDIRVYRYNIKNTVPLGNSVTWTEVPRNIDTEDNTVTIQIGATSSDDLEPGDYTWFVIYWQSPDEFLEDIPAEEISTINDVTSSLTIYQYQPRNIFEQNTYNVINFWDNKRRYYKNINTTKYTYVDGQRNTYTTDNPIFYSIPYLTFPENTPIYNYNNNLYVIPDVEESQNIIAVGITVYVEASAEDGTNVTLQYGPPVTAEFFPNSWQEFAYFPPVPNGATLLAKLIVLQTKNDNILYINDEIISNNWCIVYVENNNIIGLPSIQSEALIRLTLPYIKEDFDFTSSFVISSYLVGLLIRFSLPYIPERSSSIITDMDIFVNDDKLVELFKMYFSNNVQETSQTTSIYNAAGEYYKEVIKKFFEHIEIGENTRKFLWQNYNIVIPPIIAEYNLLTGEDVGLKIYEEKKIYGTSGVEIVFNGIQTQYNSNNRINNDYTIRLYLNDQQENTIIKDLKISNSNYWLSTSEMYRYRAEGKNIDLYLYPSKLNSIYNWLLYKEAELIPWARPGEIYPIVMKPFSPKNPYLPTYNEFYNSLLKQYEDDLNSGDQTRIKRANDAIQEAIFKQELNGGFADEPDYSTIPENFYKIDDLVVGVTTYSLSTDLKWKAPYSYIQSNEFYVINNEIRKRYGFKVDNDWYFQSFDVTEVSSVRKELLESLASQIIISDDINYHFHYYSDIGLSIYLYSGDGVSFIEGELYVISSVGVNFSSISALIESNNAYNDIVDYDRYSWALNGQNIALATTFTLPDEEKEYDINGVSILLRRNGIRNNNIKVLLCSTTDGKLNNNNIFLSATVVPKAESQYNPSFIKCYNVNELVNLCLPLRNKEGELQSGLSPTCTIVKPDNTTETINTEEVSSLGVYNIRYVPRSGGAYAILLEAEDCIPVVSSFTVQEKGRNYTSASTYSFIVPIRDNNGILQTGYEPTVTVILPDGSIDTTEPSIQEIDSLGLYKFSYLPSSEGQYMFIVAAEGLLSTLFHIHVSSNDSGYNVGDDISLFIPIRDKLGSLISGEEPEVVIILPDGTTSSLTNISEIEDTGIYYTSYTPAQAGQYCILASTEDNMPSVYTFSVGNGMLVNKENRMFIPMIDYMGTLQSGKEVDVDIILPEGTIASTSVEITEVQSTGIYTFTYTPYYSGNYTFVLSAEDCLTYVYQDNAYYRYPAGVSAIYAAVDIVNESSLLLISINVEILPYEQYMHPDLYPDNIIAVSKPVNMNNVDLDYEWVNFNFRNVVTLQGGYKYAIVLMPEMLYNDVFSSDCMIEWAYDNSLSSNKRFIMRTIGEWESPYHGIFHSTGCSKILLKQPFVSSILEVPLSEWSGQDILDLFAPGDLLDGFYIAPKNQQYDADSSLGLPGCYDGLTPVACFNAPSTYIFPPMNEYRTGLINKVDGYWAWTGKKFPNTELYIYPLASSNDGIISYYTISRDIYLTVVAEKYDGEQRIIHKKIYAGTNKPEPLFYNKPYDVNFIDLNVSIDSNTAINNIESRVYVISNTSSSNIEIFIDIIDDRIEEEKYVAIRWLYISDNDFDETSWYNYTDDSFIIRGR